MQRLQPLDPAQMTAAQKRVHDNIVNGPRGQVRGPFSVLVQGPPAADHVQALGAALRWEGILPGRLREFAILLTARFWTAQYEWCAHVPIAEKEGLDPAVIDAVRHKRRPDMADDEKAVYDYAMESLEGHAVSDDAYAAATDALGTDGVIELTMVLGYYCIISMTLNGFRVMPKDSDVPLLDA